MPEGKEITMSSAFLHTWHPDSLFEAAEEDHSEFNPIKVHWPGRLSQITRVLPEEHHA